jgi:hypothetical protein
VAFGQKLRQASLRRAASAIQRVQVACVGQAKAPLHGGFQRFCAAAILHGLWPEIEQDQQGAE